MTIEWQAANIAQLNFIFTKFTNFFYHLPQSTEEFL